MIGLRSAYGKAPIRQLHSNPIVVSRSGHTGNKAIHSTLPSIYRKVRLTSGSLWDAAHPSHDSPNISRRFALRATDVCLFGENPTCSSRHCRDARVYGDTTTAMHDNEYTHPSRAAWLYGPAIRRRCCLSGIWYLVCMGLLYMIAWLDNAQFMVRQ